MEKFGNGYKGRAATRRKMRANFRGFADHSRRSLKPVHGRAGGRVDRRVDRKAGRRVYWGERLAGLEKGDSHMTEQPSLTEQIIRPSIKEIHASIPHKGVRDLLSAAKNTQRRMNRELEGIESDQDLNPEAKQRRAQEVIDHHGPKI